MKTNNLHSDIKTGYFFTNQDMTTCGGFMNEIGRAAEVTGDIKLCSDTCLHFYKSPIQAVLFNPMHANYNNPRLFECEVGPYITDGLKCGTQHRKPISEIKLPNISTDEKIAFAILCAMSVYHDPEFTAWALNWISGADRTAGAAEWAARAAWAAAEAEWAAEAAAAEAAAAEAAAAAAWAARAAAEAEWAAEAAAAAWAARATARAAWATWAARAAWAAWAARAAWAAAEAEWAAEAAAAAWAADFDLIFTEAQSWLKEITP